MTRTVWQEEGAFNTTNGITLTSQWRATQCHQSSTSSKSWLLLTKFSVWTSMTLSSTFLSSLSSWMRRIDWRTRTPRFWQPWNVFHVNVSFYWPVHQSKTTPVNFGHCWTTSILKSSLLLKNSAETSVTFHPSNKSRNSTRSSNRTCYVVWKRTSNSQFHPYSRQSLT